MLDLVIPDVVFLILLVEDILKEAAQTKNVYVWKIIESN